jgi:uncharacterized membrane protein
MDAGLIAKWIHVVSSTVLFGTGLGTAYYFVRAVMTKDPKIIASVGRMVVQADWMFTLTSGIVQAVTGIHLAMHMGYDFGQFWLRTAIALYIVALLCWLPVVWLQIRLTRLAKAAAASDALLSPVFWRLYRFWFALGWPAFLALLAVFYLMIAKPV